MEQIQSAILLAAGKSSRMGTQKQLLPFHDRPAIVCCVQSVRDAGIDDVVVVVNPGGSAIVRALEDLRVKIATNRLPESDMSESVRAGVQVISAMSSGIFICPGDHPLVQPDTYRALTALHHQRPEEIIIPVFNGKRGHPTLFPRRILADIALRPTLRDVIDSHGSQVQFHPVEDEGVVLDMDTPLDYQKMLKKSDGNTGTFYRMESF